ncbi:MAG: hypothetical protein HYT77_00220 [Deltaproteobacteria bacterium]|nr:hypothetical protein [Deltaproteobacteria bacterium]
MRRYRLLGCLFYLLLTSCLIDEGTGTVLQSTNDGDEEAAFTPPTPIFRDVRFYLLSNHQGEGALPAGSSVSSVNVTVENLSLEGNQALEILSSAGLEVDLSSEGTALLSSTEVEGLDAYQAVTLNLSSLTMSGSVVIDGITYNYQIETEQEITTSSTLSEDLFSLTAATSPLLALSTGSEESYDITITLNTTVALEASQTALETLVQEESIPAGGTIILSEEKAASRSVSVREEIAKALHDLKGGVEREAPIKVEKKQKESDPPTNPSKKDDSENEESEENNGNENNNQNQENENSNRDSGNNNRNENNGGENRGEGNGNSNGNNGEGDEDNDQNQENENSNRDSGNNNRNENNGGENRGEGNGNSDGNNQSQNNGGDRRGRN